MVRITQPHTFHGRIQKLFGTEAGSYLGYFAPTTPHTYSSKGTQHVPIDSINSSIESLHCKDSCW